MQHFDFNNPVCILSGDEFLPKPGMTFAQQILEFFQSQGGLAHSPWGEVLFLLPSRMSLKKDPLYSHWITMQQTIRNR